MIIKKKKCFAEWYCQKRRWVTNFYTQTYQNNNNINSQKDISNIC